MLRAVEYFKVCAWHTNLEDGKYEPAFEVVKKMFDAIDNAAESGELELPALEFLDDWVESLLMLVVMSNKRNLVTNLDNAFRDRTGTKFFDAVKAHLRKGKVNVEEKLRAKGWWRD